MKQIIINQIFTKISASNNLIVVVLALFIASAVSGCSSPKLSEKTINTPQGTFKIASNKIDAKINGTDYFGFYIFNSIKDITIQPAKTVYESALNTNRAAFIAQTLRQDLDKVMEMDISNPNNYLSQLIKIKREASDAYMEDLKNLMRKNRTTAMTVLIGESSAKDLIDKSFFHTVEKDQKSAQTNLKIMKYTEAAIDDMYNLFFAGIVQINFATLTEGVLDFV